MKKLLLLCAIVLLSGAGTALAQPNYQFAEVGTKNFITEVTIPVGDQISIDLYLADAGAPQNAGGAWIDFTASTASISYVSGGRCLAGGGEGCTGPWQDNAGVFVNEPLGAGTVLYQVANLGGAVPDGDGDLIVGTLTLEGTAAGDVTVDLTTVPGVATWTPIIDDDVVASSLLIHQADCLIDADCNDGLFCTGDATCVGGVCQAGILPCPDDSLFCNGVEGCDEITDMCIQSGDPCPPQQICDEENDVCVDCFIDADCDDGQFCTGDATCVGGVCQAGIFPCPDDGDPCTDDCNEPTDTCYVCNATGTDDPCCLDSPACETAEVCLVEFNDFYVDGTNGDNLNDGLSPETAWKTITHALNTIPTLITLDDNNRAITHVLPSVYDPVMGGGDAESFPLIMVKHISLVGDAGYAETIIDAQQTDNVFEFTKEEESGDTITLDGFTISGGLNFRGGGITVLWADPTISNSYITGNMSIDINGGGIYLQRSNATIFNCIIENNTALQQKGGGISCGNESAPLITNTTIVNNAAGCDTDEGGGGISVGHNSSATIKNTILWGNYRNCAPDPELNQILAQEGSVLDITYSCIQGGHSGDGNTDQDPLFRGADDYNLMLGSSCIESADSEGAPENDIDGNERYDACFIPDTGIGPFTYYDRGAIEYQGDSDGDGIFDDADGSCTVGDNPCSGGVTESCDDNCVFIPNTDQGDTGDGDGIGDICDNCPDHPNGTLLGTCAKDINPNLFFILGTPCADMNGCGENEFCLMNQEDSNGNGIGDVCECESDFNCDQNVDADDVVVFIDDFGRNQFNNPCVMEDPCLGDLDCDRDVDADDVTKFLEDFGRSLFNNPCPVCSSQIACEYE